MHRGITQPVDQLAVERLLQHPGAAAGGVLLLAGGDVRRAHHPARTRRHALADPGAAVHRGPERAAVVDQPQRGARLLHRPAGAQVGVQRRRIHQHAGVEQSLGIAGVFDRAEQRERGLVVHHRQQLRARPAVTVLARQRATVRADALGAGQQELPEPLPTGGVGEVEVDPHVQAAVAEVPVGHPTQPELTQQPVELPQPRTEPLGRHRGVLPAGVRRPRQAACGQPGAILADPPQLRRLGGCPDRAVAQRPRRGDQRLDQCPTAGPDRLQEEPASPVRQLRHRAATGAHQVDDPRVQALARDHLGVVRRHGEQRGHGVRCLGHRRIAQHQHRPLGLRHQRDGQLAQHPERAFRPRQQLGDVTPLRQQMLEPVAAPLAREMPEPGAHLTELGRHHVGQPLLDLPGPGRPVAPEHVGGHHGVRGPPVAERPGATRVVADHPADGAAGVGGRVRAVAQPVRRRRLLQPRVDHARLDPRRPRRRVDLQHPIQPPGVHDDARADRIARDRCPGAAHRHRRSAQRRDLEHRLQLVAVPRPGHRGGHHAVERGVGGVERRGERGVVGVGDAPAPQLGDQVSRRHQCSIESPITKARSSTVTGFGEVASSRCCCSAPSTRSSTSAPE